MLFPVAGIVAEYNPFHNGHSYQMTRCRELCGAKAVVAVLSSNFVQRGEPALFDKWRRARCAVLCGADLVLELPALWSSHNAGVFANGAIDLLAATKAVTHLSFGAEEPDSLSDSIIDILLEEPEPFKLSLRNGLESGLSFVESRARAADELLPGAGSVLRGSNNTLALCYMMRIKKRGYTMKPLPIKRIGAAYNSGELEELSSASAIRTALRAGREDEALSQLPEPSGSEAREAMASGRACIRHDAMWRTLRALLLRSAPEELSRCAEIGEGIENRMIEAALEADSFEEWTDRCTSKRYPAGRIRRSAVHLLLGLGHWTNRAAQRLGPPYIRPLAMNETGRLLMREMRNSAALPIVSTCGQAARLSKYAAAVSGCEQLACELWEDFVPGGEPGSEHKRKVIML